MQALGTAHNLTPRGQLLVRSKASLRVGARVADRRGRDVGRVADLLGPVREPYVLIAPAPRADPRRLLGQELFLR